MAGLTKQQEHILNLVSVALTLKDNIQFFNVQAAKNKVLFPAFEANTISINNVFAILLDYKLSIPKEEYDFLIQNNDIFKKFDEIFLSDLKEGTKIDLPKQKPQIWMPGDS